MAKDGPKDEQPESKAKPPVKESLPSHKATPKKLEREISGEAPEEKKVADQSQTSITDLIASDVKPVQLIAPKLSKAKAPIETH